MKKTFLFAAIAVFSVVACQKEISTVPEGNYTVRASRESAVDTRSTVSDEGVFAWSAGDAIGLWNGSKFCELTTSTGGDASADFTGTVEGTAQSYAVYPYALNAKVESGIVKVTLPSSYEWKEGETNSPMLAECGESPTSLSFKHLGGLVKVTVKNVDAEAAKFVLTADKDIAGEYSVEDDGDAKVIKAAGTEANNSVAFSFKAGTATNMAFYVPVPVGEYKFTVALQKEDGTQLWSYEGSSANTVIRAKFILMPELTITSIPGSGEGTNVAKSAKELQEILTKLTSAGSGDNVVEISEDLTLAEGETWTPVKVDGYNGAGVITVKGNNHKIAGLNAPLFDGGFAGKSGIVVKDLTLESSKINDSQNTQGLGAFVGCIDAMKKIELDNCHLVNSEIVSTGDARVGGLIGWTAGYNKQDDGPVETYVTVKNCSVIKCKITANGSVGAIIGHAGSNPATYHTIEGNTVKNCELISTDDGGWRVGVVVGTANVGEVTINSTTESDNTLSQTGKTAPEGQSNLYGRFVPGSTGKLTIDGKSISK